MTKAEVGLFCGRNGAWVGRLEASGGGSGL